MAEVVQFPSPAPAPLLPVCGEREDVPYHARVHVWLSGAAVGDPCQCGAQRLPRSARQFLSECEPGDYIEADERG